VQHRKRDFRGGFPFVLRVFFNRDPSSVVNYPATPVGQQGDVNTRAIARHGLVDGVVHDLPDEVVEARRAGRADVHTGSNAYWFEALKNGDVTSTVTSRSFGLFGH
jgi:hypothetical protein